MFLPRLSYSLSSILPRFKDFLSKLTVSSDKLIFYRSVKLQKTQFLPITEEAGD